VPDTEASATTPAEAPAKPGRVRGRIVAVFIAVSMIVFAIFGIRLATQDRLEAELHSWDVARDGVLPVRVELYRPADRAVSCSVIARDLRQVIVGQVDVDVPAGPDEHLLVDVEVPLEGDGVAPEIQGCRLVE
jgi:hypothetical protein